MDLSNFGKFPSLRGKTVFVTGGGSGIGAAIVEGFVDQGARVAFVDIDEAASRALCDRCARNMAPRRISRAATSPTSRHCRR